VRTFNPVTALWYGVHRPSVHVFKTPFNIGLSFDLLQKTLKARLGWTKNIPLINTLSHGRSSTFVTGSPKTLNAILPQTCPDCTAFVKVEAPNKPLDKELINFNLLGSAIEVKLSTFDCDKNMDVATPFIKPLFMKRFSNYG